MSALRKFSRKSDNRNHLYRNLATSLVLYEKIETTEAKCKELKKIIDTLITSAKKDNLCARRALKSYLFDDNAVAKMFEVMVPRFADRSSGYTKITKILFRKGDGSLKCIIEFVKPLEKPVTPSKESDEDSK